MKTALFVLLAGFLAPPSAHAEPETAEPRPVFELLGESVLPGERRELELSLGESFAGDLVETPVIVLHGIESGPTLCLTGGVHGDEINGVEIVRRVLAATNPNELAGTLIGVPIVNLPGFRRSSRYLPDRRDLNRYFPGRVRGSSASRIAFRVFDGVVRHCDALVDMHTGSFHRRNLPQIRADLKVQSVYDLALGFGAENIVHSAGTLGTLRHAAVEAGIPAITYEAGEPMEFRESEVNRGVQGVLHLMSELSMAGRSSILRSKPDLFYRSRWVRADAGGIFLGSVKLGERVRPGKVLGTVTDPVSNERVDIITPWRGRVIGLAVNQVVMPGFAAFHLGIDADAVDDAPATGDVGDDRIDLLDEPVELDERPE